MMSFHELNRTWANAVRTYALTELPSDDGGTYRAIGDKTFEFLDEIWATPRKTPMPDIGKMIEDGQGVRFFGDCNMGHPAILTMCVRPLATVEDMNETLWSNIVSAADEGAFLVNLGDWSMGDPERSPLQWQRRLHQKVGDRQVCIMGYHDAKGAVGRAWAPGGGAALAGIRDPD